MDQDRQTFDVHLFFTEKNTALGTINATADISDANMEAIGFCGALIGQSGTAHAGLIDQVKIMQTQSLSLGEESVDPFLIQAENDSTSVYVSGIVSSGTPNFTAADDLDII